jgi:hypothetical protein
VTPAATDIATSIAYGTRILEACANSSGLSPCRVPGAELVRRYPGGQAEYAAAFRAATSRAVADGFLLAEDADEMVADCRVPTPAGSPGASVTG